MKALTAQGGWVCSADDYFLDEDGTYVYDAKQVGTRGFGFIFSPHILTRGRLALRTSGPKRKRCC